MQYQVTSDPEGARMIDYEKELSQEQFEAALSENNVVLKACPGSGKTRTITYRIANILEHNRNCNRYVVALTYTNRAAEEIAERIEALGIDTSCLWIGTIHQFCLEWIIKKYRSIHPKISKGYRIIDEFEQQKIMKDLNEKRGDKLNLFDLNYVFDIDGNPTVLTDKEKQFLREFYKILEEAKLIDFNQILYIAYEILKDNVPIRVIKKGMISHFLIDEYQDTQELQYQILGLILNADVSTENNIFFAGDSDQAIYSSIGGVDKELSSIEPIFPAYHFLEMNLCGCYRSSQRIADYYSKIIDRKECVVATGENRNSRTHISYLCGIDSEELAGVISKILISELSKGVPPNDICIVAPSWYLIFPLVKALKELLPEMRFDAPDASPIKRDPLNAFYNICKCLLMEYKHANIHKYYYASKLAKSILQDTFGILVPLADREFVNLILNASAEETCGSKFIEESILSVIRKIGIDLDMHKSFKESLVEFLDKMNSRISTYDIEDSVSAFRKMYMEKSGVVISSCHGVKGEEYHTVIGFGLLEGKVPHWKEMKTDHDTAIKNGKRLIYVTASRAKQNLFLISESRYTKYGKLIHPTMLLKFQFEYDNKV